MQINHYWTIDGLKFILTFKDSKTEVLICGPSGACEALEPYVRPTVKNLGVIIDSDFKLDKHIHLSN